MKVDVAVVGGGLVGAALALGAAAEGAEVAVVEASLPPPARAPRGEAGDFDLRVVALSLGSCRFLAHAGVWARLRSERTAAFEQMRVWDGAGPSGASIHFDAAALGLPLLGRIAENWVVLEALDRALAEADRIQVLRPARLASLQPVPGALAVALHGEREPLTARLVVGADGTDSTVRELAGIDARRGDYGQRAVVATVEPERFHQDTAWQRFLRHGPVALLPLPAGLGSIVWSTTPEHAAALVEASGEAFAGELGVALEHRLGTMRLAGERASFPLRRLSARGYAAHRVALVGDAAHTIHPLAGQGVNLGLLDAACLAELVGEAVRRGADPGGASVLRRYERWRKAHNAAVQLAMDGFHRLFGSQHPAAGLVRGLGLRATDRAAPLKRLIMGLAMGVAGDLPEAYRRALPDVLG